jgi:predicted PurR-regulated permease PerM
MQFQQHADLTLGALRRWLIAQCYDSLLVSGMWLAALTWLHVPWALFWALLAGGLQWIPHFGPLVALLGPAMAMLFSGAPLERWFGLLAAYAAIAMIDGFLLQPYLMHRTNRVPVWASLLTPILLGIVLPFWGVLFAPPLLAVIYAYRGVPKNVPKQEKQAREQQFSERGEGIVLPPEKRPGGDA